MATRASSWIGFHLALLLLLGLELAFSRWRLPKPGTEERPKRQHRNALAATAMWIAAAAGFGGLVLWSRGTVAGTQFFAGYAIEEALSVDNLFVFLLLFRLFGIAEAFQPRVLFWGVLGAIAMRGAFIAAGVSLLERFEWVGYVFAAILLVASVRLVMPSKEASKIEEKPEAPVWVRWISTIQPVSLRKDVFFTREQGRGMVTMLFLSLIAIETADIVFALDSIPAVLSITRVPFIAYSSNILAVMGLRSLYFLLVHLFKKLRFLHFGLAAVLMFASVKMLIAPWFEIGPLTSLGVIVGILTVTICSSCLSSRKTVAAGPGRG